MRAAESRPAETNRTATTWATNPNDSSVTPDAPEATESAEVYEARLQAWAQGYDSRSSEVDYANDMAAKFYELAFNPGKQLTEVRERRMNAASEQHWADLVSGVAK